jgi:uncharacterized membrane protein YfcA
MTSATVTILLIISLLAVIQSVFGMGILIFGTPTLLLMGISFGETLAWLLPSSVAISAIQTFSAARQKQLKINPMEMFYCVPPLIIGLFVVILSGTKFKIDIVIAIVLLSAASMRLANPSKLKVADFINRRRRTYLTVMGLIHGLTNMGGALLTLYATSLSSNKEEIRNTTAKFYLLFGLVQMTTLYCLRPQVFTQYIFFGPLIAAFMYLVLGNGIFKKFAHQGYQVAITGFIAAYGLAILLKSAF